MGETDIRAILLDIVSEKDGYPAPTRKHHWHHHFTVIYLDFHHC
ncbi:MAG: hypothetical protein OET63_07940 [Desulfobacterales bacterium]|jgi:hypothetical protein|nr:hypothetical protein [Desulfobacterales bacterium]